MKLIYSVDAVNDLIRLRSFIEEKSPAAAARIAEELVKRIDSLLQYPEMGHSVALAPEPKSIRDMVFGDYVVRYIPRGEVLIVLRIWHHYENR
ncbi:MAG: type II toxin-antitoxin system RelE/ParE family toxin [Gammaproteobacteria bacterium]|nr:type II toxin-antitoxin system RelE/ParE family toxin [Gammaproteobacteria bacterium]